MNGTISSVCIEKATYLRSKYLALLSRGSGASAFAIACRLKVAGVMIGVAFIIFDPSFQGLGVSPTGLMFA
jgi:hypothetical protein